MTTKEYNGWTNYETWVVNLWMDNNEGSQGYWAERAQEIFDDSEEDDINTREQAATHQLADELKDQHEEALPEVEGFAADLLNGAMSEVNWHEIAEHLINEVEKPEPENEEV